MVLLLASGTAARGLAAAGAGSVRRFVRAPHYSKSIQSTVSLNGGYHDGNHSVQKNRHALHDIYEKYNIRMLNIVSAS